jgi:uncharacterized spore protein YtfJ
MSDLLSRLSESIQIHANAKQVYGEPVERDGTTIIPVARVQWGFGGGGIGRGPAERGGGGGGAQAIPTGFIELKNGVAEFRPIADPNSPARLAAIGAAAFLIGVIVAKLTRR